MIEMEIKTVPPYRLQCYLQRKSWKYTKKLPEQMSEFNRFAENKLNKQK